MFRTRILIVIALTFWLSSALCFAQEDTPDYVSESQPETQKDYVISADDIIKVNVYGENDLSTTLKVSQDGTINYPLLGTIRAAGLTVLDLEKNITELLGEDYLVMPQVNVFIEEYAKFSILGAVERPGSFEIKEKLTLTQALAIAGGLKSKADASNVRIIRIGKNEKETIEVDVEQIIEKALRDVEIKTNDTIVVGEYGNISVIGQVMSPGIYAIKKNLTAMEAISMAGGFTPLAAQNGTRVIRDKEGRKQIIPVPVASIIKRGDVSRDVILQVGDTIVVPESFF